MNPTLKQERLVSPETLKRVKQRDGVCLWGLVARDGCSSGLDAHHIEFKGAGGDDDLKNLICLCRRHHQLAQERKIAPQALREVLSRFYGYTYEE